MLMKKILLFFETIMLSAGLGFAQSRNIKAHEIEFRIERYRRYVIEIVALNFGEIFERRSECRNRRARLVEFKLGESVFFEMFEYYFGA